MSERKHCRCRDEDDREVTIRFDTPLEVKLKVEILQPKPEFTGLLTIGPVSNKKKE